MKGGTKERVKNFVQGGIVLVSISWDLQEVQLRLVYSQKASKRERFRIKVELRGKIGVLLRGGRCENKHPKEKSFGKKPQQGKRGEIDSALK